MDIILNKKIGQFLENSNPDDAEIREAAKLLLQVYPAKYRPLYNTIIAHCDVSKFVSKLKYELGKHYVYLKEEKTREQVVAEESHVISDIETLIESVESGDSNDSNESEESDDTNLAPARGKRADHESLPDDIKAIWEENAARYKAIKKLFNTLKAMENAEPCDRYETVKQLKDGYDLYRKRMAEYDEYSVTAEANDAATETANVADMTKLVSNARAYISKNKDKVIALMNDESKREEFEKRRDALKKRVDILVENNVDFDKSILNILG